MYSPVKAVLLQASSGPEGSRKLRFLDFMTTAQDGGKVVSLTHRPPLFPGNTPGTNFLYSPVPWDYSTFGVAKNNGRWEYVGGRIGGGVV